MPESTPQPRPRPHSPALAGVSMHDLLASCAAAATVSTPPRVPDAELLRPTGRVHREAA